MLFAPHLLIGAAIATQIHHPLALVLVFLSHYLLDLFPHWEYHVENIHGKRWSKSYSDFFKVFLDISFGILLILLLSKNSFFIFTAALLSILPDAFTFLFFIFPKNKLLEKHFNFHRDINCLCINKKVPPFWGIFSELLIFVLAIFFIIS